VAWGDHGDGVFVVVVRCSVCKRQLVFRCPPLALQYNILYYGTIVLSVGICIVVLDHTRSLSNIWHGKTMGEKKMTNQLCVLCVVKNCYLLITIFPTANMRRAYAGIGICGDD
jgi:hypothetical protein